MLHICIRHVGNGIFLHVNWIFKVCASNGKAIEKLRRTAVNEIRVEGQRGLGNAYVNDALAIGGILIRRVISVNRSIKAATAGAAAAYIERSKRILYGIIYDRVGGFSIIIYHQIATCVKMIVTAKHGVNAALVHRSGEYLSHINYIAIDACRATREIGVMDNDDLPKGIRVIL